MSIVDAAKAYSIAVGATEVYSLSGGPNTARRITEVFANNQEHTFYITNRSAFEVVKGRYSVAGSGTITVLERYYSSNSGEAVLWPPGVKEISAVASAADLSALINASSVAAAGALMTANTTPLGRSLVNRGTEAEARADLRIDDISLLRSAPKGKPYFMAYLGDSNAVRGATATVVPPANAAILDWCTPDGYSGLNGEGSFAFRPFNPSGPARLDYSAFHSYAGMQKNNSGGVLIQAAHELQRAMGEKIYTLNFGQSAQTILSFNVFAGPLYAQLTAHLGAAFASSELSSAGVTYLDAVVLTLSGNDGVSGYSEAFFRDEFLQFKAALDGLGYTNRERTQWLLLPPPMDVYDTVLRNRHLELIDECTHGFVRMISTAGIQAEPDMAHFPGDSCNEIGRRVAAELIGGMRNTSRSPSDFRRVRGGTPLLPYQLSHTCAWVFNSTVYAGGGPSAGEIRWSANTGMSRIFALHKTAAGGSPASVDWSGLRVGDRLYIHGLLDAAKWMHYVVMELIAFEDNYVELRCARVDEGAPFVNGDDLRVRCSALLDGSPTEQDCFIARKGRYGFGITDESDMTDAVITIGTGQHPPGSILKKLLSFVTPLQSSRNIFGQTERSEFAVFARLAPTRTVEYLLRLRDRLVLSVERAQIRVIDKASQDDVTKHKTILSVGQLAGTSGFAAMRAIIAIGGKIVGDSAVLPAGFQVLFAPNNGVDMGGVPVDIEGTGEYANTSGTGIAIATRTSTKARVAFLSPTSEGPVGAVATELEYDPDTDMLSIISSTGAIRISCLSGTGTRAVVASPTGVLSAP